MTEKKRQVRKVQSLTPNRKKHHGSHKKFPAKSNPLFNEDTPLPFDDGEEQILALTEDQMAARFAGQWQIQVDPFARYSKLRALPSEQKAITFRHVKNNYKRFVLHGDWDDQKYAMVIDSIFGTREDVLIDIIEKHGKLYDEGLLESQLVSKRVKNRRRI